MFNHSRHRLLLVSNAQKYEHCGSRRQQLYTIQHRLQHFRTLLLTQQTLTGVCGFSLNYGKFIIVSNPLAAAVLRCWLTLYTIRTTEIYTLVVQNRSLLARCI